MTYGVIQIIRGRTDSQALGPAFQAIAFTPFNDIFFFSRKEKLDIERQTGTFF